MKIIRILNIGIRAVARGFGVIGRATIALVGICGVGAVLANYAMTQGSGTSFGSIIVSTIHYAQMLSCDPVTPSQCGLVTATGGQIVDVANANNQLHTDLTSPIPTGANVIGHVIADTGSTTAVTALPALPTGSNVIGHVIADTGSTTAVTALPATPAGTNTIGTVGQLTYPVGAVPLTASATGTTGATTATLAGAVAKTTYICSLSVRANATANTNVTNTVTGVITGTLSRAMWVPANTAGLGVDEQIYNPCVPASGTNQAIAVVSGAPGTGGVVTVNATGYQL